MVDPRFVATLDVMSGLDHRPNLMELTPTEFEGLITELFVHMGLDTRQTRPSRDGGVDCVAFDPRPVFGGKVVIQRKRYKQHCWRQRRPRSIRHRPERGSLQRHYGDH